MKNWRLCFCLAVAVAIVLLRSQGSPELTAQSPLRVEPGRPLVAAFTARVRPLLFEPNWGQASPSVRFLARTSGYGLFITADETVLAFSTLGAEQNRTLRLRLAGGVGDSICNGLEPLPSKSNYFVGNDPSAWRTAIPHFGRVRMENVYPNVDLDFYGTNGEPEFDFILRPGADPNAIRLRLEGMDGMTLDAGGSLRLTVGRSEVVFRKPDGHQERDGRRVPVPVAFRIESSGEVSFALGDYDPSIPLTIDPVLSYSTYLGGPGLDVPTGLAVDASGNAYLTGQTRSVSFPSANAFQPVFAGGAADAFIVKLDSSGALVYSTFLGGNGDDATNATGGIAVDTAGNVFVTGPTTSTNFPTVNPIQAVKNANWDLFIAKLNAAGSALVYSTYYGGSGFEASEDIAVDSAGNAYIVGVTGLGFPTTPGAAQTVYGGDAQDMFVMKVNSAGTSVEYATYLGGSGQERGKAIAVDSAGSAYVTGEVGSRDFPVTAGAFQTVGSTRNSAVVTKLSPDGSSLEYSTYLSDACGITDGLGIAVDASLKAVVVGNTESCGTAGFPTTPGAHQPARVGSLADGFITKLNAGGTALEFSTFLGGTGFDRVWDVALDSSGDVVVAGITDSADFPVLDPIQSALAGATDNFVAKLAGDGSSLLFSTYLGGTGPEYFSTLVRSRVMVGLDGTDNAYVAGTTRSLDFPVLNAVLPTAGGAEDGYVARITFQRPNQSPAADAGPDFQIPCQSVAGTTVTLDGSASQDPDGDSLTFTWSGPFPEGGGSTNGVTPSVTLPLGMSSIQLVVKDGQLDSAPDTVNVTVAVTVQGLLPPMDPLVPANEPVPIPDKALRKGRTLPLRLQMFCGSTPLTDLSVSPPALVMLIRNGDPVDLTTLDIDSGEANDSGLLFRFSDGNWVYNLSTTGLSAGTYLATIQLPDGLRYSVALVLR